MSIAIRTDGIGFDRILGITLGFLSLWMYRLTVGRIVENVGPSVWRIRMSRLVKTWTYQIFTLFLQRLIIIVKY